MIFKKYYVDLLWDVHLMYIALKTDSWDYNMNTMLSSTLSTDMFM